VQFRAARPEDSQERSATSGAAAPAATVAA
jgi:hypothetical protein